LPVSPSCRYLFFSKSGFSEDLVEEAKNDDRLVLVDSIFDEIPL
jgi:hypothetical protein